MLGRRDPTIYGGLSLNELESRIYGWAHELDISARCRQTNSEGEYIGWIHDAYDNVDGADRQPGRVEPLQLRDPRRARAPAASRSSRCTSPTSTSARNGGGTSVVAELAAHRVIGKGPDGYREALEFLAGKEPA